MACGRAKNARATAAARISNAREWRRLASARAAAGPAPSPDRSPRIVAIVHPATKSQITQLMVKSIPLRVMNAGVMSSVNLS